MAREVFMASQLPNDVLSAIWRLSDMDGDSQLSHLEFRIAMHMVMQSFRHTKCRCQHSCRQRS